MNGISNEEREQALSDWIWTKHNGLSRDVNNNKKRQIEREIKAIVAKSLHTGNLSNILSNINSRSPEYRKAQQVSKSVKDSILMKLSCTPKTGQVVKVEKT